MIWFLMWPAEYSEFTCLVNFWKQHAARLVQHTTPNGLNWSYTLTVRLETAPTVSETSCANLASSFCRYHILVGASVNRKVDTQGCPSVESCQLREKAYSNTKVALSYSLPIRFRIRPGSCVSAFFPHFWLIHFVQPFFSLIPVDVSHIWSDVMTWLWTAEDERVHHLVLLSKHMKGKSPILYFFLYEDNGVQNRWKVEYDQI